MVSLITEEYMYAEGLNPALIEKASVAMATLDAALCPEWEFRYHSFNKNWSPGERMASMRNGEGGGYFLVFSAHLGVVGLSYGRQPLPQAALTALPNDVRVTLSDPAFMIDQADCFIYWTGSEFFKSGPAGGALDRYLFTSPQEYVAWAEGYYEKKIELLLAEKIFAQSPIVVGELAVVNANIDRTELSAELLGEVGYPLLAA